MLQDVVASVDDTDFEIEDALDKQLGSRPMPFPGMDSKPYRLDYYTSQIVSYFAHWVPTLHSHAENKAALCEFFMNGTCTRGAHCPFRHVRGERTIVCKHWLRHLCKKGDDCEFLHEYDMSKMPICYFFQKFGECNNKDCQYLHIDADALKIRDCAWYDRGFCKHGEKHKSCSLYWTMQILGYVNPLPQVQTVGTDIHGEYYVRTTFVDSVLRDPSVNLCSKWSETNPAVPHVEL